MKTYTAQFRSGLQVQEGLELSEDPKLGLTLRLGEEGRGRELLRIPLDKFRPPTAVENGRVYDCVPKMFTVHSREYCALEYDSKASKNILVRIKTYSGYRRGGRGNTKTILGESQSVVVGWGAFGEAGNVGSWTDSLEIMTPNSIVRVYSSCNQRTGYLYYNGKMLQSLNRTELAHMLREDKEKIRKVVIFSNKIVPDWMTKVWDYNIAEVLSERRFLGKADASDKAEMLARKVGEVQATHVFLNDVPSAIVVPLLQKLESRGIFVYGDRPCYRASFLFLKKEASSGYIPV
jgi:hypothetical protein